MRGGIRSAAAFPTSASISRADRTSPTISRIVGRYYADYVRLMAHVDDVLPGRVHRVIYERMVDDTEAEVRRAARLLRTRLRAGLPEFYKTDRAVRTASSEQVRQPIYRDATEEWRATNRTSGR